MKLSVAQSSPSWVVLQLLEECNLRCSMCYEWGDSGAYHGSRELASLDVDVALRVIRECAPQRPTFELFGGEPLLYAGIWDVIRAIRDAGCELAFPTNGTQLERHAEQLVACGPDRLWVSLDGPERINDAQRGRGVYKRVMRGLAAVIAEKQRRGSELPRLGVTCVVSPVNHLHLAQLFGELDLGQLSFVSLELQSFVTEQQYSDYVRLLRTDFGIPAAPYARAYLRDPAFFAVIDRDALAEQMQRVRAMCKAHSIRFFSQPRMIDADNIDRYLRGAWDAMPDKRTRCAVPWKYAEISARGDVTTCHTFYDAPIGNVYERPLLEVWRGDKAEQLRAHLREQLLPICTACCRYYQ
jgi:radical SAM protein with 4Fe4S-binding SPASM domain